MNIQGLLYLIADEALDIVVKKLPSVLSVAEGFVSHVQLRITKFEQQPDVKLLEETAEIIHAYQAKVIVNRAIALTDLDYIDGIHTGADALTVSTCRKALADNKTIGYSAHYIESALQAAKEGADYILLSPIFQPLSKTDTRPPLGLEALLKLRNQTTTEIFALGGITPANACSCLTTGARGVATLSLLMRDNPDELMAEFATVFQQEKLRLIHQAI